MVGFPALVEAQAPTPGIATKRPQAAPPPVQFTGDPQASGPAYGPLPGPGPVLWSIGQPADGEQLYLEYINRSRANPTAEGQRLAVTTDPEVLSAYSYFSVDLAMMQAQFSTNPAVPPLAMNAQLTTAARLHSQDMLNYAYQGHYETNNGLVIDLGARISAQGYSAIAGAENVFSYAQSVFHGHAGFNVDWGLNPPSGMQNPPGHRNNIHNGGLREVGVGLVLGSNGTVDPVGPQLVTQDFATSSANQPFVTGVAFYDLNGNGFYDPGEGIGGVRVDLPGSSYYAVTAESGGYAVPVTTNGNYIVRFTTTGWSNQVTATVASLKNVKADLSPAYSAPVPSGPNPAALNQPNTYTFNPVPGATNYQWQLTSLSPYATMEGAENGLANVTVTPPGWSVIDSSIKTSGSYSFALAPDTSFPDLYLTLNPLLRLNSGSVLSFAKRVRFAVTNQTALAQISIDSGVSWSSLWSQTGNGSNTTPTDAAFTTNNIPLGAYAGQIALFRFGFLSPTGGFHGAGSGVNFDNIVFSNADQALALVTNNIASGTAFAFTPTVSGSYLLQVRPKISTRFFPWGPALLVSAQVPPPSIQLAGRPVLTGSQVQIDFTVGSYVPGMTFELWKSTTPNGSWAKDTGASIATLTPNTSFRATTTTGGSTSNFYRVKGIY